MLSPLCLIAVQIRNSRRQLRLTQRDIARGVGCSQPYIAQVETGRRPVSRKVAEKLERLLEVEPGMFTNVVFLRGRPPLLESTRQTLRAVRQAVPGQPTPSDETSRKPRFPRPDWAKAREDSLSPPAPHLGERFAEEVRRLELARSGDERFWRALQSIRFDSWIEKSPIVQVARQCDQLTGISMSQVGCSLPSVNGITGRKTSHRAYPAFVLQHKDAAVVWYPQRCVRTPSGYRWPDNLLIVARQGRKRTVAVEVDCPEFHSDAAKEMRRDKDLAVPVLHLSTQVLSDHADILPQVLDWACAQVAA